MQGCRQGGWTQEYLRDPLPPTTCLFNSPGEQLAGVFWGKTWLAMWSSGQGKLSSICVAIVSQPISPDLGFYVLKDPVISEWPPQRRFPTLCETSLITHNDDPPLLVLTAVTGCCSLSHYRGNWSREWMCTSQPVPGKETTDELPQKAKRSVWTCPFEELEAWGECTTLS